MKNTPPTTTEPTELTTYCQILVTPVVSSTCGQPLKPQTLLRLIVHRLAIHVNYFV